MQGIILGGSNNVFDVECEDSLIRQCSLKGKKLKTDEQYYNPLAPGDLVQIEEDPLHQGQGQITALVPRKNEFVRWNVKGRAPQLLAANLDYIVCITTPDSPPFRPRFVDRMLIQADAAKITPLIVCNKCDLPISPQTEERLATWRDLGYQVLRVSAKTGEGLSELAYLIEGKLSAFAGQSGVGKSSLINALDSTFVLRTGSISQKHDRGIHTTTQGMLFHLTLNESLMEGRHNAVASIIDTPGVRRFVLHGIAPEDLLLYFPELEKLSGQCAFGMSCSHTHEEGCLVLEALKKGDITADRFESWQRIKEEIETDSWND